MTEKIKPVRTEKQTEEIDFNKKFSRFKLHMYFNNKKAITYYSQERYGCTVSQIRFGHIKQVTLDREKGLQDCIDHIDRCVEWYGPYQVALIFDRKKKTLMPDGSCQQGKEIMKYVKGKLVEWDEYILPPNEKQILTTVIHENGRWDLKP